MEGAGYRVVSRLAMTVFRKVVPWVLRHPFVLRPGLWRTGIAASVALIPLGVLSGFLPIALVGVLGLVVGSAATVGWRRLTRKGALPSVFVAQFQPTTPGAEEASLNHQIAMRKRLAEMPLITEKLEFRELPAVIAEGEAERLLDVVGHAEGVIRGSVQAIATVGSFDAILTFRTHAGPDRDLVLEKQRSRDKIAFHHRVGTDFQMQLGELVSPHFSSNHADGVEGMLLVLLGEEAISEGEFAKAEDLIAAAEPLRDHLPASGQTHLTLARTFLENREDPRGALRTLDDADRTDRDLEVRRAAAWIALYGMGRKVISPVLAVREIRRAIEVDSDNELLHLWLTDALTENKKPDEALAELNWLKEHNFLLEHDAGIALRAGVIEYNRGNYPEASEHYLDLTIFEPTARANLYLADAYLNLGKVAAAKHFYREALLLEPDLVDAHRGYWWGITPGAEPQRFFFDRAFRLVNKVRGIPKRLRIRLLYRLARAHHKRHPEDSRIHFMLGAHALLLNDLTTAEERLLFANEIVGGIDTEAIARLVLVALKKGNDSLARQRLEELKAVRHGRRPTPEELQARIVNLYLPVLDGVGVLNYSQGERLAKMVEQLFPTPPSAAGRKVN